MARKPEKYPALGKKIARLARSQIEIARLLGLTQQSISGKLRGQIAISIEDLRRIAEQYKVPLTFFFAPEGVSAKTLESVERMVHCSPALREAIMIASDLPREFMIQLWQIVKGMQETLDELGPPDP